jgi:hypothetical protein
VEVTGLAIYPQGGMDFTILPQSPECWEYWDKDVYHMPGCLALESRTEISIYNVVLIRTSPRLMEFRARQILRSNLVQFYHFIHGEQTWSLNNFL